MNLAAGGLCGTDGGGEITIRSRRSHTNQRGLGSDRRLRAHPDDVIDLHIVGEEFLLAALEVDNRRHPRLVEAPEIQPRAVLAEFVTVVLILGRRLDIADKQQEAGLSGSADALSKGAATGDVGFFWEHILDV